MNKRLSKHKKKKDFIKIYLADDKGTQLKRFDGIILDYDSTYILMLEFSDFSYDGYVIFRKSDVSEIKHSKNEKFYGKILAEENILSQAIEDCQPIQLGKMKKMFKKLQTLNVPVIVECIYGKSDIFQIGPVLKAKKKKAYIKYFSACGEFDLKPVVSSYKDITYVQVDSPYANLFFKYVKHLK